MIISAHQRTRTKQTNMPLKSGTHSEFLEKQHLPHMV